MIAIYRVEKTETKKDKITRRERGEGETHVCSINHILFFFGSVVLAVMRHNGISISAQRFVHYKTGSVFFLLARAHFCPVSILTLSIFISLSCFPMVSTSRKLFCRRLGVHVCVCLCAFCFVFRQENVRSFVVLFFYMHHRIFFRLVCPSV